ncbi:MAG: hypothetical protein ACRDQ6_15860, partial [Pseudonocardiaceae bacterium]
AAPSHGRNSARPYAPGTRRRPPRCSALGYQPRHHPAGIGQHESARQLAEDTLTRMHRVLGDNHPDTLRSTRSLAAALGKSG